jgi:uncharacterized protein with von Willebrand factor type A (vWA) domain
VARSHRYRYGHWRGGRDPLAPPFDLRAALDRDRPRSSWTGPVPRDAVDRLLRRGLTGAAAWTASGAVSRSGAGDWSGGATWPARWTRVRAALDQVLAEERATLAGEETDAAAWRRWSWPTCPDDTASAVR